jgi:hypothetical protein
MWVSLLPGIPAFANVYFIKQIINSDKQGLVGSKEYLVTQLSAIESWISDHCRNDDSFDANDTGF